MFDSLSARFSQTKRRTSIPPNMVSWIDTTPVDSSDVPCEVQSLEVQARVFGIYAEVVQTIEIWNPNQRDISASLVIPLPDRAVVCGYALDIGKTMVDGVVVPKEKARVVFETEQRRGADPGLVEAVKGNVYNTRVYPVPARSIRTVRLRYVAPLLLSQDGSATLDLPMPNEHLKRRALRVDVEALGDSKPVITGLEGAQLQLRESCWSLETEERDVRPDAHVTVGIPELPPSFALLERDDEGTVWFVASEKAQSDSDDQDDIAPLAALTVLWDASGSRAAHDHAAELELLQSYCAAESLKSIELVVFDNCVRETYACAGFTELAAHIGEVCYDGGTNFAAVKAFLAQAVDADEANGRTGDDHAYLIFTDGLDTLGEKAPLFPNRCNVVAIVSGSQRDVESMRQACGGLAFGLASAPTDATDLAKTLCRASFDRDTRICGEGVADTYDASAASGSRRAVIGRLDAQKTTIELEGGATSFTLEAGAARSGNILASAWAARRVAQLSPHAEENADELLSLGRRFGIVSPVTSLIVLETLAQWLVYDIEPPATLPELREAWNRSQQGKMVDISPQKLGALHRSSLASEWAKLLDWWNHDFSAEALALSGSAGSAGTGANSGFPRFCTRCGARLVSNGRFCPMCGAIVEAYNSTSDPGDTGQIPPISAPNALRRAVFSVEDSADYDMFSAAPRYLSFSEPDFALADCASESYGSDSYEAGVPFEASAPFESGAPFEAYESPNPSMSVNVRAWAPDTPYLKAMDEAWTDGIGQARKAYYEQRAEFCTSPSFFLDCTGWFVEHDDVDFAVRVLTNLAELRIEDAALLRVMAWRLREMGQLEQALVVLRRVLKLRPEDAQSHRDLSLVLDELARAAYARGDEDDARHYAEEAGELYKTIVLERFDRHPLSISLFAVEEYNVLRAWADAQTWEVAPDLPSLGQDLEGTLDCDLRITLAWDADETDVDIHVTEPTGEEAYFRNRQTGIGGRVSEDIVDGYGPELYEIHKAQEGTYNIRAHYYASHQQAVFGPATCTLTIYTDWGRATQTQQITTMRLTKEHEMIDVGTVTYRVDVAEEKAD